MSSTSTRDSGIRESRASHVTSRARNASANGFRPGGIVARANGVGAGEPEEDSDETRRTPCPPRARNVSEVIPPKVQPSACSELEEPERMLAPLEDVEKATHKSRRARYFVRLHRVSDGDTKLVLVIDKGRPEVLP